MKIKKKIINRSDISIYPEFQSSFLNTNKKVYVDFDMNSVLTWLCKTSKGIILLQVIERLSKNMRLKETQDVRYRSFT